MVLFISLVIHLTQSKTTSHCISITCLFHIHPPVTALFLVSLSSLLRPPPCVYRRVCVSSPSLSLSCQPQGFVGTYCILSISGKGESSKQTCLGEYVSARLPGHSLSCWVEVCVFRRLFLRKTREHAEVKRPPDRDIISRPAANGEGNFISRFSLYRLT